jgi:hypothetical protein
MDGNNKEGFLQRYTRESAEASPQSLEEVMMGVSKAGAKLKPFKDALLALLMGEDDIPTDGYIGPENEAGARQKRANERFLAEQPGEKAPIVGPIRRGEY